jgi:hypothetical protein
MQTSVLALVAVAAGALYVKPSAAPPAIAADGGGPYAAGKPSTKAELQMKIAVGSNVFTATLVDNKTTRRLKAMLPLTLNMSDLNANEKYFELSKALPTSASRPGKIHAGDVMLYGSNTLVLFYKTFSTGYSYTRIGKVDDVSGLAEALGSQNVTVTFTL